jgi:preprotein translocase subunit YajC
MALQNITALLAMGSPSGTQSSAPALVQMFPLILMFVMLYFVLIRPQQKKAKQHEELLKTLRPGDRVLTASGIIATVVSVKEKSVSIRSADTKLEVLKSAVSEVTERGAEAKSSEAKES